MPHAISQQTEPNQLQILIQDSSLFLSESSQAHIETGTLLEATLPAQATESEKKMVDEIADKAT